MAAATVGPQGSPGSRPSPTLERGSDEALNQCLPFGNSGELRSWAAVLFARTVKLEQLSLPSRALPTSANLSQHNSPGPQSPRALCRPAGRRLLPFGRSTARLFGPGAHFHILLHKFACWPQRTNFKDLKPNEFQEVLVLCIQSAPCLVGAQEDSVSLPDQGSPLQYANLSVCL